MSQINDQNLMTPSNLGVCFGPTLLRTAEESVAAILDIKFVNVIAELLIENYEKVSSNSNQIFSANRYYFCFHYLDLFNKTIDCNW